MPWCAIRAEKTENVLEVLKRCEAAETKAIRGKAELEARHVRPHRFFRIFKVRSISKRF
nr:MAG TPA_asm: hypothetical protein [Bacteriophage sp.]